MMSIQDQGTQVSNGSTYLPAADAAARFIATRKLSEALCAPLATEDYVVQGMPEVSPPKWHLGHTTWFFEHFLLKRLQPGYQPQHPKYHYLFNSYYTTAGSVYPRNLRGLLSRPTVAEIFRYRQQIDTLVVELLAARLSETDPELHAVLELGINHEQQHQELLLTDIKYNFFLNPLRPSYSEAVQNNHATLETNASNWTDCPSGIQEIGSSGAGFVFDNETPRHRVYINRFRMANRLTTNAEYLQFIHAGGYQTPALWLADGWAAIQAGAVEAPLYWELQSGQWQEFTLLGLRRLEPQAPVAHVSYFEADAYARWRGCRLPTEAEWETLAATERVTGNFLDSGLLRPQPDTSAGERPQQLFGDVWEWTQSAYLPYHGYRPLAGSLGEYNGKFMCNQYVLRGGSCLTPGGHIRASYRNFFYPDARWQCSGIRLVRSDHE